MTRIQDALVTPYPEDYRTIYLVAWRLAKREVETQLRDAGIRVTTTPPREINEKATELLRQRPDIYREAVKIVAAHPEWRNAKHGRWPNQSILWHTSARPAYLFYVSTPAWRPRS